MRVVVDSGACLRYGQCALEAPEVFALEDDDEVARVIVEPVPVELMDRVEAAVDLCPMQALALSDD